MVGLIFSEAHYKGFGWGCCGIKVRVRGHAYTFSSKRTECTSMRERIVLWFGCEAVAGSAGCEWNDWVGFE